MEYQWARNTIGQSGCAIYRLHGKAGAPELFLKHGRGAAADDLAAEVQRLRWLAGRIAVPSVVSYECSSAEAWLLTTALPGQTAYQMLKADPRAGCAIVDRLAAFLRRLHEMPLAACPFDSSHVAKLAWARERIDAGLVDVEDFDDERAGWTAEQVWEAMHRLPPFRPDQVVTHGDFSLDNILLSEGGVAGCIDVGQLGVADRYQDLAILWNCLGDFGPALQERLFLSYGIAEVDADKLQFHLMLDELF